MNRRKFLLATASSISLVFVTNCTPNEKKIKESGDGTTDASAAKAKPAGYWTCTMHPQVHRAEPGKCPICGMPLVHVLKEGPTEKTGASTQDNSLEPSETQIKNANMSKYTVTKKDFIVTIPVSGRMVSPTEISFQVYESDLSIVKPGLEINGLSSTNPDQMLKGHVSRIDNIVDPSSRTIRGTANLQTAALHFVAETSFHGQIQSTLKNALVIPDEAVLHAGKRDLVYVFTAEGRLDQRPVVLGPKSKGEYQVLSGLEEGEVISAGANFLIDSEAKIRGN